MRRIGTALALACLAGVVACSADVDVAPQSVRVAGPGGLSYVVPPGPWHVEPDDLRWSDGRGRAVASLSQVTSFEPGYAVGDCGGGFSARAVAGFTSGSTLPGVVRRFARAVGGTDDDLEIEAWRATLPGDAPARFARLVVDVPGAGRCQAREVGLTVVSVVSVFPEQSGERLAVWVLVGDRGPDAVREDDVVALAASLRSD